MDIKQARLRAGIKQSELAHVLGIDTPLLSKLENGIVLPSEKLKSDLEKVLASPFEAPEEGESINISTMSENPFKTEIDGFDLDELKEVFADTDADHPITRYELARAWNTTDRQARGRVEQMRNAGVWILPAQKGYYLCSDPDDPNLRRFLGSMRSRSRSINKTVKAMISVIPGQIWMDI